jgi:hypothetical protein
MSELPPIELETATAELKPATDDKRPKMPEPLPVRLIAVADVQLAAQAGKETSMDEFYVEWLGCLRIATDRGLIYQADNFRVCFELIEGMICHESYRPLQAEIPSLAEIERKVIDAEMEYVWQRGLTPGSESILLRDPCGNWVELTQKRELS